VASPRQAAKGGRAVASSEDAHRGLSFSSAPPGGVLLHNPAFPPTLPLERWENESDSRDKCVGVADACTASRLRTQKILGRDFSVFRKCSNSAHAATQVSAWLVVV
jgi:hypothetical protein